MLQSFEAWLRTSSVPAKQGFHLTRQASAWITHTTSPMESALQTWLEYGEVTAKYGGGVRGVASSRITFEGLIIEAFYARNEKKLLTPPMIRIGWLEYLKLVGFLYHPSRSQGLVFKPFLSGLEYTQMFDVCELMESIGVSIENQGFGFEVWGLESVWNELVDTGLENISFEGYQ